MAVTALGTIRRHGDAAVRRAVGSHRSHLEKRRPMMDCNFSGESWHIHFAASLGQEIECNRLNKRQLVVTLPGC
jgi:hypothetical protein